MSDTSSLSELARFIGQSKLSSEDGLSRARPLAGLTAALKPRPQRHSVAELLGVVLVLSARTRRSIMPRVEIDLDVFAPGGGRALRLILPRE